MPARVVSNALVTIPAVLAGIVVVSILGVLVLVFTAVVGAKQACGRH